MPPRIPHFQRGDGNIHRHRDRLNAIIDAANAVSVIRGDGLIRVSQSPTGYTLSLDVDALRPLLARRPFFLARIGANAEADDPPQNRWHYAWTEMEFTGLGYDGIEELSSGRSGTTTDDYAINMAEAMNDSSGVQNDGTDIDGADYPAGFAPQPTPADLIVRMYAALTPDGIQHHFWWPTGHDGTCEV